MCFQRDRLVQIYDALQDAVAVKPTAENVQLARSLDAVLTCPACGAYAPKLNGEFRLLPCGCSMCKAGCFQKLAAGNASCPRCVRSIY